MTNRISAQEVKYLRSVDVAAQEFVSALIRSQNDKSDDSMDECARRTLALKQLIIGARLNRN